MSRREPGRRQRGRIGAANRARILAAAEQVFAREGFKGATTAAIAAAAGLPKANVHYYFATKEAIYRAVIDRILRLWLGAMAPIGPDDDPALALAGYIRRKMRHSFEEPLASRIFALEVISGAPVVRAFLAGELKAWVEDRAAVIRTWIAQGRMDPIEPAHLFFTIWAATQTYADFDAQMTAVLGSERQSEADQARATDQLVRLILKGCGLAVPLTPAAPDTDR